MEGARDDSTDLALLRDRVAELEDELQARMGDLTRLDRELRSARADVVVKDEFIAELTVDADGFQRIRNGLGRLPLGPHLVGTFDGQLGVGGATGPGVRTRVKAATAVATRRARTQAGRVKRRLISLTDSGS